MKKAISLLLCLCLIIYIASPIGFAIYEEDSFSVNQYTLSDILAMNPEEQFVLLREYEEEYDPFGMNAVIGESAFANGEVQPLWDSGNTYFGEPHQWKTHELITIQALAELEQYLNTYGNGASCLGEGQDLVTFVFDLAIASALPDRVWNGVVTDRAFAGHFYNPETGKNTLGETSPTAKTNAISEWNAACAFLSNHYLLYGPQNKSGIESLGCALHYIQDVCEPHHSSNVTVQLINNSHGKFEEYTYNNFASFADCSIQHTPAVVSAYSDMGFEIIVDLAALTSHQYIDMVNNVSDQSNWNYVADICVDEATSYTMIVLYKILKVRGFI